VSNQVVRSGQSLWSIAKSKLPEGASTTDIKSAAAAIAAANGLPADAQLQVGQRLVIPDSFAGTSSGGATSDAMARLSSTPQPASSALSTRLGATARPLLDLPARFSPTTMTKVGDVSLPDVAGKAVKGETFAFQGMGTSVDQAMLRTTVGTLGKLSQGEFDAVHKELGGRSTVKYDPDREYTVRDFLPPALQALVNQDFEIPAKATLVGSKSVLEAMGDEWGVGNPADIKVYLSTNCHATAWEAMRAYQGHAGDVALFVGDMIRMADHTDDQNRFSKIGVLPAAEVKEKLLGLDLKPGDVVQFYEESQWGRMTMLLHSAVYVGGGLFFEKPNTEGEEVARPQDYVTQDETPYRLATVADLTAPYDSMFSGEDGAGSYRVEVKRAKANLEDPAIAFTGSLSGPVNTWAENKGRSLGTELVVEFEQGSMGGILAEHVTALKRVKLEQAEDGSAFIR